MRNFAFLLVIVLLSACGGNKENTSSTGDVHGDGRCTQRYVDAFNVLAKSTTADNCESFKTNHGQVSCLLHLSTTKYENGSFRSTGGEQTVSYSSQFKDRCEPLVEAKKSETERVQLKVTIEPTGVDALLVKDLDPSWITIEFSSDLGSEGMTFVEGRRMKNTDEFTEWLTTNGARLAEEGYTDCGFIKPSLVQGRKVVPTKISTVNASPSTDVIVELGEPRLECEKVDRKHPGITVGGLKRALGNYAKITVLKK